MSVSDQERLKVVAKKIDEIIRDVGPKLIKLGHLRAEMKFLLQEVEVDVTSRD